MKPKTTLVEAIKYAYSGIWATIKQERNIKIELVFAVLAVIAAAALRLNPVEWTIIIILIGMVIAAELLNSALEAIVDLVSPEVHHQAKHAKDAAAGAVLVLAIIAVIAGLIIYVSASLRLL